MNELEKIKSLAEQKFIAITQEAKELANRCKSIVITDKITLSQANMVASEANKLIKTADNKRLEINKPAQDSIKVVNALVGENITDPLEEGVKVYKERVKEWNAKEAIREANEKAHNEKRYKYLKEIEANLQDNLNKCDTTDKCIKLIENINKQFPSAEVFIPYAKEALNVKATFIKVITEKKWAFENNTTISEETIAKVMELTESIDIKNDMIESSTIAVKSSTRKQWKWEIIERTHVPYDFYIIDEVKVRKYISEHKKSDGSIVPLQGFRFFQEDIIVIK